MRDTERVLVEIRGSCDGVLAENWMLMAGCAGPIQYNDRGVVTDNLVPRRYK